MGSFAGDCGLRLTRPIAIGERRKKHPDPSPCSSRSERQSCNFVTNWAPRPCKFCRRWRDTAGHFKAHDSVARCRKPRRIVVTPISTNVFESFSPALAAGRGRHAVDVRHPTAGRPYRISRNQRQRLQGWWWAPLTGGRQDPGRRNGCLTGLGCRSSNLPEKSQTLKVRNFFDGHVRSARTSSSAARKL